MTGEVSSIKVSMYLRGSEEKGIIYYEIAMFMKLKKRFPATVQAQPVTSLSFPLNRAVAIGFKKNNA